MTAARFLVALVCAAVLAACAAASHDAGPALDGARYVLLGEVHDNAEHHRRRAELLRRLLADGRPTRVVFEQMERAADADIADAPRDAEAVASAGRLGRRAWGWPLHKPLFESALQGGAAIAGGNLEVGVVRAIVRDGLPAVPAALRPLLANGHWTAAQQSALEALIDAGHCGTLPRATLAPMALAQRARDASMAQAMMEARPGERVVLIAGNGHVRRDLGVPHYLRAAGVPDRDMVAYGFVEEGDESEPFDRRAVMPRAERADPCETLRR